jgi:hypothetical protein
LNEGHLRGVCLLRVADAGRGLRVHNIESTFQSPPVTGSVPAGETLRRCRRVVADRSVLLVKPTVAVSTAIRAVRSALAGIDRTHAVDLIRRRQAEMILSALAHTPVAILIANDRARFAEANAAATTLPATRGASCWKWRCGTSRRRGIKQTERLPGMHSCETANRAILIRSDAKMGHCCAQRTLPRRMCCRACTCRP